MHTYWLSIVGAEKVTSPEHSRRFMLKPSIIYTDLFEAVSFSLKNMLGTVRENYAVYIIPQECIINSTASFLNGFKISEIDQLILAPIFRFGVILV